MILKSFYRKKSIKIYLTIFSLLITVIVSLSIIIKYIDKTINENFMENNYIYFESSKNIFESLKDNNDLVNLFECLTFNLNNSITKIDYIEGKTLFIRDLQNKLFNNEVIINLNENDYKRHKDELININLILNETEDSLKVKDVVNQKEINYVILSDSLFSKILSNVDKYEFITNIKSENMLNDFLKELDAFDVKNILILSINHDDNMAKILNQYLYSLKLLNYIIIFIFLIVFVITENNILFDLRPNIELEYKLGFGKLKIKLNFIKRILTLHITAIINAIIISYIICYIINKTFYMNLMLKNMNFLLLILILLNDFILGLLLNVKIERR